MRVLTPQLDDCGSEGRGGGMVARRLYQPKILDQVIRYQGKMSGGDKFKVTVTREKVSNLFIIIYPEFLNERL